MSNKPIGRGRFSERPLPEDRIDLAPTKRQIRWMQFLNLHGPLPSSYLFELEGKFDITDRHPQKQLKRLWQGGYVCRPRQQRATDNANYNQLVYDLTPEGKEFLIENGLWVEAYRPSGNFVHQLFIACITATIDIMCQREGYRYMPPHEYLGDHPLKADVAFTWINGEKYTRALCPDAMFAIDYGDRSFIAYALEADRNTEPSTSKFPDRKTDARTARQYVQFIGQKQFAKDYGRTSTAILLFVTTTEARADRFLAEVQSAKAECAFVACGVVPEFDTPYKPPTLLTHLFEKGLTRAGGRDPFTIKKTA